MLRRVALVRPDVSEELTASIIRVTRISELGTSAVTSVASYGIVLVYTTMFHTVHTYTYIVTCWAANTEVPSSISGATRFSELQWVWNGVHSALVRINEELLERKLAAPV
jgi:hypothetical protein